MIGARIEPHARRRIAKIAWQTGNMATVPRSKPQTQQRPSRVIEVEGRTGASGAFGGSRGGRCGGDLKNCPSLRTPGNWQPPRDENVGWIFFAFRRRPSVVAGNDLEPHFKRRGGLLGLTRFLRIGPNLKTETGAGLANSPAVSWDAPVCSCRVLGRRDSAGPRGTRSVFAGRACQFRRVYIRYCIDGEALRRCLRTRQSGRRVSFRPEIFGRRYNRPIPRDIFSPGHNPRSGCRRRTGSTTQKRAAGRLCRQTCHSRSEI